MHTCSLWVSFFMCGSIDDVTIFCIALTTSNGPSSFSHLWLQQLSVANAFSHLCRPTSTRVLFLLPISVFHHSNQAIEGAPVIKRSTSAVSSCISGWMIVLTDVTICIPLTHHEGSHLSAQCLASFAEEGRNRRRRPQMEMGVTALNVSRRKFFC